MFVNNSNKDTYMIQMIEKIKNDDASFDECLHILNHRKAERRIKEIASQGMKRKAQTFSQWLKTYNKVTKNSDKKECLEKMTETAKEPNDWDAVYSCSKENLKINSLAFKKLNNLSLTLPRWISIYNESTKGGSLENISMQHIEKMCDSFTGWDIFSEKHIEENRYRFDSFWKSFKMSCYAKNIELREFAVKQFDINYNHFFMDFRGKYHPPSFWDWDLLLIDAHNDEFLIRIIAMEMFTIAETFDEWRKVYHLAHNEEIKRVALIKMAETASGLIEKKRTCHCTPENSLIRKEIGNIMRHYSEK